MCRYDKRDRYENHRSHYGYHRDRERDYRDRDRDSRRIDKRRFVTHLSQAITFVNKKNSNFSRYPPHPPMPGGYAPYPIAPGYYPPPPQEAYRADPRYAPPPPTSSSLDWRDREYGTAEYYMDERSTSSGGTRRDSYERRPPSSTNT